MTIFKSSLLIRLCCLMTSVRARNDPNCGHRHNDHLMEDEIVLGIFNGSSAIESPREFPWIGMLVTSMEHGAKSSGCSATILNKRWILTAAHCVHDRASGKLYPPDRVVFIAGVHFSNPRIDLEHQKRRRPEKIFSHPHFSVHANEIKNDIALIKLSTELDLKVDSLNGPQLASICLPHKEDIDHIANFDCVAVGWGTIETEHDHLPQELQKSFAKIWKQSKCRQYLNKNNEPNLPDSKLCWGGKDRTAACNGDSGGPLLCHTRVDGRVAWVQYGIVSYFRGPRISDPNANERKEKCEVSVMTRVSEYSKWIWDVIEKN